MSYGSKPFFEYRLVVMTRSVTTTLLRFLFQASLVKINSLQEILRIIIPQNSVV